MAKDKTITPMNLLVLSDMAVILKTLSPATKAVFAAFDALRSSNEDATAKTVALLEEYTADGIPAKEVVETFEGRMKEKELWPINSRDEKTGEIKWMGVVQAKSICLAAQIRERLYNMVIARNAVTDSDGLLQFHTLGDETLLKNEKNTASDGSYTRGKARGDSKESIDETAKRVAKEKTGTNPTTPNPEQQQTAKTMGEAKRNIEKNYGIVFEHTKAMQVIIEKHRPFLAESAIGKAFLTDFDNQLDQHEVFLYDFADALAMKEVEGKFVIKTVKAS